MRRQALKKYMQKKYKDPLPPLQEDERIYFEVPYVARGFAKYAHCGFDSVKKLWFTGCHNANLHGLVTLYDVSDVTSEKAKVLLEKALNGQVIE